MMKIKSPYTEKEYEVVIRRDKYVQGKTPEGEKRLYFGLDCFDEESEFWEPYCDITVNLPDTRLTNKNCAFVDVNNAPNIEDFLEFYELAVPTGRLAQSGFCFYPEYEFDMEKLEGKLAG